MSDWLANTIAQAEKVNDWLSPQRNESLKLLRDTKWPTRKTELWKYTPVRAIERARDACGIDFSKNDTLKNEVLKSELAGVIANSIEINLINGDFQQSLSEYDLPSGVTVSSFSEASSIERAWAAQSFTSIKPCRHLFGLVNDVMATQGIIIDVAPGAIIERPIQISNMFSQGYEVHTRVVVRLGAGAKATVIEHFQGDQLSVNTGFSEYEIGEDAQLEHYRLALQKNHAVSVGGCHFLLATKANLNTTMIGFGSDLSRVDVDIIHQGEHAFAKMNALYLLDNDELFDLHSTIEHKVPFGTSEENVRGIAAGKSRAVFNGRIHIHRDAQKTLAELQNRNLLMSDKAQINTKPELEIYADDVRCAHGATVSEIDSGSLYYMQSRGISRADAQILLSFGFINELVDQIPCEQLAQWLRPRLRERFAQMDVH